MKDAYSIRKLCGFTQKDIAEYLGIARSTFAMFEQRRRKLSPQALKRLETLLAVSANVGEVAAGSSEPLSRQMKNDITKKAALCRLWAKRAQRKLEDIEQSQTNLVRLKAILPGLSKATKQDKMSSAWVSLQQKTLPQRVEKYNRVRINLQCRINSLLAEAKTLEEALNAR